MTPAGELLRDEITAGGPIAFRRFMEVALYHPQHGYYRRGRDPFGRAGDYYTAEQVQPAFGILIRRTIEQLAAEMGGPVSVVEPGAGRGEMAPYFAGFHHLPIESGDPLSERFRGVIFANEFFDALPVNVAIKRGGVFHRMLVDCRDEGFVWTEQDETTEEETGYLAEFAAEAEDESVIEIPIDALHWIDRIAERIDSGYLLAIDYGYTPPEIVRFPRGTLMSYRRHQAMEDVLAEPGERDITAHVPFGAIEARAASHGFHRVRWESMASMLLRAGETDEFAEVIGEGDEASQRTRRLQLKKLLFEMGETFRALLMRV